ncbi:MAG: FapA family protein [Proteobacteria bacterium]|nr:FapA family protein [Pseudomonadota bacterium]MBU1710580.1 FapA family protein [Pseudomonadota bacterium]
MAENSVLIKQGVMVFANRFLLKLSRDKLEATLLPKDELGMKAVDLIQLFKEISGNGVVFGLLSEPELQEDGTYCVARGTPAEKGKDANVKLHIKPALVSTPRQHQGENARVDHRELQNIVNVKKDLLLLEKIPPTSGTSGHDVLGREISTRPGKDRKLKVGPGVYLSEDGSKVFAKVDGKYLMEGGKPAVYPDHIINGDVDMSVGNIVFGGQSISISGEVHPGFQVKCRGDIEILKGVNSAQIIAGSNLIIKGGVIGPDALVRAKGDIHVDFMENNCVIEAFGNFFLNDFLVQCTGRVNKNFIGPIKGGVIGGELVIGASMYVNDLGSDAEVTTQVGVGVIPGIMKQKKELDADFALWSERLNETIKNISGFEKIKKEQGDEFPEERLAKLTKYKTVMPKLMEKVDGLQAQVEELQETLDRMVTECIYVYGTVFPGVTIRIGKGVRMTTATEEQVVIFFDKQSQQILIRKMQREELDARQDIAQGKKLLPLDKDQD